MTPVDQFFVSPPDQFLMSLDSGRRAKPPRTFPQGPRHHGICDQIDARQSKRQLVQATRHVIAGGDDDEPRKAVPVSPGLGFVGISDRILGLVWRDNLGETGGGDQNGMRRPVARSRSSRFVPQASRF